MSLLSLNGNVSLIGKRGDRQSNMELLRILSMFMVLIVHIDGASLGLPDVMGDYATLGSRGVWQLTVESIAIVGVNCFTLISGYFSIRLTWRSMGSYLFQCLFYAVGITTAAIIVYPRLVSWNSWLESWLILSHTDLWYVPAYFGLMIISPILNKGTEALSRREFLLVGGIFLLFNLWCGWWMEGRFNPTGYTLIQLILMYIIGRYIRLHVPIESLVRHSGLIWLAYLIFTAGIFLISVYMKPLKAFAYNSPAVIGASVALLMAFSTLQFKSGVVNYVAKSSFAVYLLHKSPLVWGGFIKPTVTGFWQSSSLCMFTVKSLGLCIAVYVGSMAVDSIRRRLNPFGQRGR